MPLVEVTFRAREPDQAGPILATFASGQPASERLSSSSRRGLRFRCLANEGQKSKKRQRLLTAESSDLKYTGKNFGVDSSKKDSSTYFIGVYSNKGDSENSSLEIIPAGNVFSLRQSNEGRSANENTNSTKGMSLSKKHRMLVETFGSKRAQRVKRAVVLNAVSAKSVTGADALADIVANNVSAASKKGDSSLGAAAQMKKALMASRREMLPPFNIDAETPEEAYQIDMMITKNDANELRSLTNEWKSLVSDRTGKSLESAHKTTPFHQFVIEHMRLLCSERDLETKKRVLLQLAYLNALITIHKLPFRIHSGSLDSLEVKTGIPEAVLARVLAQFSEISGRGDRQTWRKSDKKTDKLRLSICVLALSVGNFSIDLSSLCSDLVLVPAKVSMFFRELGCNTDTRREGGSVTHRARLQVPLTFPQMKRGRK